MNLTTDDQVEELQEAGDVTITSNDQQAASGRKALTKRASLLSFILPPSPLRRELASSDSSSSSPSSPSSQRTSPIKSLRRKSSSIFQLEPKTSRRFSMYGIFTGSDSKINTPHMDSLFEPLREPVHTGSVVGQQRAEQAEGSEKDQGDDAVKINEGDKNHSNHFRPMRYEVKAELDKFFGQTKNQKRDMALRTKDEDGHVWYDGIEQEEFAQLLSTEIETPSCFSRRSSFASSACQSHSTSRSRHGSFFLAGPLVVPSSGRHDVALFHYSPFEWATSPMQPFALDDSEGISFDVVNRRRKRDTREIKQGNCVVDDRPMPAHFSNVDTEERGRYPDIQMPAFLPLKRHQNDTDLINEAFNNPFEVASTEVKVPHVEMEASRSLQQHARRERPADLRLHHHNVADWDKKVKGCLSRRASMICSPKDLPSATSSSGGDDSYIQYLQRRRSSFDSSDLSPFGLRFKNSHLLRGSMSPASPNPFQHRRHDSRAKADALLGKNALNEKLLVPAGLSTGLHVYDGVDIPCRSVHLPSDDEDDVDESINKMEGKQRKSMANIKTWLKGKSAKKSEE